ncbi:TRAF3-interacting JNK-activating modulator [Talpa occidentalis]|uniref:TRAF3-interacting JNK-activating modulator n=1 Tax=Talpa occidentalis TaxID=50954 RepID=UPI00188E865F|nr:TRAF3-interacting JNK-activating modulator [Talpa occidentalis]
MGPDPRPAPYRARGPESYEAKCERRQEARESRRRRPNMTTCRPAEKAQRAQHREQLQRARQQQLSQRRCLEVGEQCVVTPSPGQAAEFGEPPPGASRISAPRQQVTGSGPEATAAQLRSCSGVLKDLADQFPSQMGGAPSHEPPLKKPPQHHRGTQTAVGRTQTAVKKDASQQTTSGVAVLDKEIIQLSEYLKEALQRELVLKQKMVILQDLLATLLRASDHSWKGQLDEDRLKGRLRALESQLRTCTQKSSPGGMKRALMEMEEQRSSYEQKAKETLQKVLEEKLKAEQQLQSTQRSLALTEQKCEEWRRQHEALQEEWRRLGAQHRELESQLHILQSQLQGADSRDCQMNQALRLLEREHQELQATMDHLQGGTDVGRPASLALQDELRRSEEEKQALQAQVEQLQGLLQERALQLQEQGKLLAKKDQALPVWSTNSSRHEVDSEDMEEKGWDFRDQLQKATLQLQAKEQECRELRSELDNLSDEYLSCLHKLQHCREELNQGRPPPPRRQCGRWLPVLVLAVAVVLAMLLANGKEW